MTPLKVLHITPSFYPAVVYGGPTYSVYRLCGSLTRNGCQVRVLTTNANGPDSVLNVSTRQNVEIVPGLLVRYCRRILDVSVSPALLRALISEIRWADVVHLTAVYSFPTIPALVTSTMMGKPVVWSPRGMLQRWEGTRRPRLKQFWELVCRLVAPKPLLLHTTSTEEAAESSSRFPGVEAVVVPNGVDIPPEGPTPERSNAFHLVYLGRLDPKKGIENLLKAYALAQPRLPPDSLLTIAGSGDDQYRRLLERQIGELNLKQHVRMIGSVDGETKEALFQNADIVIIPSHTENFGIVVAEALAHAIPVIASRGTPWSRLEEIGCGLWVENDPGNLANSICRMKEMPLRDMGARGRAWMQREFSWDSVAGQMMQVYQGLLPNHEN